MSRYIIEGQWAGYRSSQNRIVHRTVHHGCEKTLRAWAEGNYAIRYTDGTSLILSVRDCKPRERVKTMNSYMKLIRDCAHYNVCTVEDLIFAETSAKEAARAAHQTEQA